MLRKQRTLLNRKALHIHYVELRIDRRENEKLNNLLSVFSIVYKTRTRVDSIELVFAYADMEDACG